MPYGNVTGGEAGTYYVGYARSLHPLEAMARASTEEDQWNVGDAKSVISLFW
jgi:hypothetical protein